MNIVKAQYSTAHKRLSVALFGELTTCGMHWDLILDFYFVYIWTEMYPIALCQNFQKDIFQIKTVANINANHEYIITYNFALWVHYSLKNILSYLNNPLYSTNVYI